MIEVLSETKSFEDFLNSGKSYIHIDVMRLTANEMEQDC